MDSDGGNLSIIAHGKGIEPELIKEEATDFTLRNVDGEEFSLSDFEGRIVVLEFMRIGCLACDAQTKHLKNLKERYGENVTIISLGVGEILGLNESVEDLREYRNSTGADWIFAKSTEEVAFSYMTEMICPAVFVIDEEGYVRYSSGLIQSMVLENVIDKIIEQG
jgi:peroxiredoxin